MDAALCHGPKIQEGQTITTLTSDELILVSTEERDMSNWDTNYIYVDAGEEFRIWHAATYAEIDTSSIVFGGSTWALEHLLKMGGSAYLSRRLVHNHIKDEQLHQVTNANKFKRPVYFVTNDNAVQNWSWILALAQKHSNN